MLLRNRHSEKVWLLSRIGAVEMWACSQMPYNIHCTNIFINCTYNIHFRAMKTQAFKTGNIWSTLIIHREHMPWEDSLYKERSKQKGQMVDAGSKSEWYRTTVEAFCLTFSLSAIHRRKSVPPLKSVQLLLSSLRVKTVNSCLLS